jgi:hypothetical protein
MTSQDILGIIRPINRTLTKLVMFFSPLSSILNHSKIRLRRNLVRRTFPIKSFDYTMKDPYSVILSCYGAFERVEGVESAEDDQGPCDTAGHEGYVSSGRGFYGRSHRLVLRRDETRDDGGLNCVVRMD